MVSPDAQSIQEYELNVIWDLSTSSCPAVPDQCGSIMPLLNFTRGTESIRSKQNMIPIFEGMYHPFN